MQIESKPIRLSTRGKVVTVAIITLLTIFLLHEVEHVLGPFIAAIITAYLFNPLINLVSRRTNTNRIIWIVVLYVLAGGLIYGVTTFMWPRITAQYYGLINQIPNIVTTIQNLFGEGQEVHFGGVVFDLSPIAEEIATFAKNIGGQLPTAVPSLVFSAVETVVYLLVYLIITFYLLLQADQLMQWFYGLIPAPYRGEIRGLVHEVDHVLSAYIRGQLVLIVVMSVLMYIPLSILGIRYALLIAILSGILEIIPFIGPWSAAGIAIFAALIQGHEPFGLSGIVLAGVIGLTYLVMRLMEDNFIIPTLVGHFVKLHPAIIIFALLAGAALGGAFGLFVAIPVAAVIRIILVYIYNKLIDNDKPISESSDPPPSAATTEQASQTVPATTGQVERQGRLRTPKSVRGARVAKR
jgi:predicted PurR-regulated permease PerM